MPQVVFPAFYLHDEVPWAVVRQNAFTDFERFNPVTRKWEDDRDLFYDVVDDYHHITQEQADEVIAKIPDGLSGMDDEKVYEKLSSVFC